MKIKNLIALAALTAVLAACTGCGGTSSSAAGTSSAAETTTSAAETTTSAAETTTTAESTTASAANTTVSSSDTTAAQSEEKPADTTAAANTAENAVWFERGVYAQIQDGSIVNYYVFSDAANGRTSKPETGIGIGFVCEQEADKVTFHMGSADDNTVMLMQKDSNGDLTGTMQDNNQSFIFKKMNDADPEGFDGKTYRVPQ